MFGVRRIVPIGFDVEGIGGPLSLPLPSSDAVNDEDAVSDGAFSLTDRRK